MKNNTNQNAIPFTDRLETRIKNAGNCICMGMDPVLSLIPIEGTPAEVILEFYMKILEEMDAQKLYPAAVKPNSAYYECLGIDALRTLQTLIEEYKKRDVLVILDAKRGDIGKSSQAYADAAFSVYHADSVTVSPYMGSDSVKPFLQDPHLGVYTLLRTSNKGAADFQDVLTADNTPFYQVVAQKLLEWDNGNLGAVVGATNPQELEKITSWFCSQNAEIPFLIPGVSVSGVPGQQGGDAKTVLSAIKNGGSERNIHLLNSSSGLSYAWQRGASAAMYYPKATLAALAELSLTA
jgi:orotidine-5'-phosphate decarboxylase